MTAQIILSNQLGIALASDTTVTSGSKTLQTVSKLVALPAPHRVAVMIANNVFIGNTHVRLLVTEWGSTLKAPLKSLEEYADDFVVWVGKNAKQLGFEDVAMLSLTAHQELQDLFTVATEPLENAKKTFLEATPKDIEGYCKAVIALADQYGETNFKERPYHDLNGTKLDEFHTAVGFDTRAFVKEFIEAITEDPTLKLPMLEDRLIEFVKDAQCRYVTTSSASYFNFAGFGSQDIWPCHVELEARSVYSGRLRARKKVDAPQSPMQATNWIPIAQQDAMADMLRGMSTERRIDVFAMAQESFDEVGGLSSEAKEKFSNTFVDKMERYFDEYFSKHTNNTLQDLSPATLVEFAELLVKIQSMRSATQNGPVSVGGSIECLAITKESGIQWVSKMTDGRMLGSTELAWLDS